jgi:hypothetical protein
VRIFILFFLSLSVGFAQNNVSGLVVNQDGKPVQNALVQAPELALQTQSDENGIFVLNISSAALLTVSADSYQTYVTEVTPGEVITISLVSAVVNDLDQFSESMSLITLSDDELSEDDQAADNISGLLQSSRDVFLRTAAYEFSSSFFRVRGLDSDLGSVRMNGVPMNKFFNGRPQWSNWGGLNDLMRNQEFNAGLQTSDYGFGGLIGSTNINTKASSYRSGGRVTYSSSNRSYANRVLVSYASGLNTKGWAYALAVSNRWGESGYSDGTFYDAQSFMLSVEKVLEKQSLNLTLIATPNRRGKSSPNTQEVYDLMGTRYNEYWGNQNGEQRNSRVKRLDEPIVMLNHEIQLSTTTTLQSSVAYQFGELGNSRFDYPGGANPSPTYYQKLPSYFLADADGPDYAGAYLAQEQLLINGQIDWNRIYDANITASASDLPAAYVLYEDRSDDTQLTLNTSLKSFLSDEVSVVFALTHQDVQSENFAEIQDLMGASNYLNRDSFDGYAYNLEDPDGTAGVGDRFKYNYIFDVQQKEAFVKAQFSLNRFDGFAAGSYKSTSYQREGLYRHGAYADNSFGKGKKLSFDALSGKAGLTYKLSGIHLFDANAAWMQRAPHLRNTYANSRENHYVVGELAGRDLELEELSAYDVSYILRAPKLTARLTAYHTAITNASEISFFFAEGIGGDTSSFVQEISQNIDKEYQGVEFGFEANVLPALTIKGAASVGRHLYANDPSVYLTSDDFGYLDFGTAKMKNLRIANGPQEAHSLGFEYRENYWWFGFTTNFFNNTYVDASPINRTQNFLLDSDGLPFNDYDPDIARELLQQEEFGEYMVSNIVLGKSWRINRNFLGFFLSINNLFNEQFKTGGFEQSRNANFRELRQEFSNPIRQFGPKYWYGRGTNYFLNVYVRF